MSFNSTSEDISAGIQSLLRSAPWGARFSQTRKDATVARFTAISTALSGDDFDSDETLPPLERKKVSFSIIETHFGSYDADKQFLSNRSFVSIRQNRGKALKPDSTRPLKPLTQLLGLPTKIYRTFHWKAGSSSSLRLQVQPPQPRLDLPNSNECWICLLHALS